MIVYLVILEDRHTDVEVEVYVSSELAMARARERIKESDEGDCVVEKAEVKGELDDGE